MSNSIEVRAQEVLSIKVGRIKERVPDPDGTLSVALASGPSSVYRLGMTSEFAKSDAADAKRSLVDALYQKYSQALWTFLLRQRVKPDEVADIVQETYCRIQQAGHVDTIRNPRAFLFRVASNIRFNERKRRRCSLEQDLLDIERVDVPSEEPSAYRSFQGEQDLELVRVAFEELSDTCREAFVMNRFEGLTFTQIAVRLDVSVSMVEKHVAHAVSHMRTRLEDRQQSAKPKSLRVLK